MILSLWRYVFGYVVVKMRGAALERFINRLAESGVHVWDVQRLSTGMIIASMGVAGFRRARNVARGQGWRIQVAERAGLPFVLARVLRRRVLVLGGVAALVALYIASGYVWFVRVETGEALPVERILRVASEAGLRPGVPVRSVDSRRVQRDLLLEIDELAWAAVNLRGTSAIIEVAPRRSYDATVSLPGDVIASRSGVIEEVIVFEGHPLVEAGMTVSAGDVLISGFIPPEDPRHTARLERGESPYVRADGIVTARVWYEGRGRSRTVATWSEPTGKRAWEMVVSVGDRTMSIGSEGSEFERSVMERREWHWTLWNGTTVSVQFTKYREVSVRQSHMTRAEAEELARVAALAQLEAALEAGQENEGEPRGRSIGDRAIEIQVVNDEGEGVVEVVARLERVEPIAAFRPMSP